MRCLNNFKCDLNAFLFSLWAQSNRKISTNRGIAEAVMSILKRPSGHLGTADLECMHDQQQSVLESEMHTPVQGNY